MINGFPDKEKALELNTLAVEIAKLEPSEIDDIIKDMKKRLEVQRILKGVVTPTGKAHASGEA